MLLCGGASEARLRFLLDLCPPLISSCWLACLMDDLAALLAGDWDQTTHTPSTASADLGCISRGLHQPRAASAEGADLQPLALRGIESNPAVAPSLNLEDECGLENGSCMPPAQPEHARIFPVIKRRRHDDEKRANVDLFSAAVFDLQTSVNKTTGRFHVMFPGMQKMCHIEKIKHWKAEMPRWVQEGDMGQRLDCILHCVYADRPAVYSASR